MKIKKLFAIPLVLGVLALGTVVPASAQVASPRVALQFATNGLTSPLTASSTDAVIARLLLDTTGSSEAVRISSLPFNLIVGGGGIASTLNNCQVFNEVSPSSSLSSNNPLTLSSGVNQLALNTPLVLAANTTTILALRCDVASNLVTSSTYTVNMNTANVVATGANTGTQALVTVRGAVVTPPPVVTPPATPGVPSTGMRGPVTQSLLMLLASTAMASLGFSYLLKKKPRTQTEETS